MCKNKFAKHTLWILREKSTLLQIGQDVCQAALFSKDVNIRHELVVGDTAQWVLQLRINIAIGSRMREKRGGRWNDCSRDKSRPGVKLCMMMMLVRLVVRLTVILFDLCCVRHGSCGRRRKGELTEKQVSPIGRPYEGGVGTCLNMVSTETRRDDAVVPAIHIYLKNLMPSSGAPSFWLAELSFTHTRPAHMSSNTAGQPGI